MMAVPLVIENKDWVPTAGDWADSFAHSFIEQMFIGSPLCAEDRAVNNTDKSPESWSLGS